MGLPAGRDHPQPLPSRNDGGLWLRVPFKEKEAAKQAGARWDGSVKAWFAPKGADMAKLAPWLPPLGPVARKALGAGRIIGYWRNALGVEDLDNLLKEAKPVGDDIPLERTLGLPEIPKGEPSPYLLLVGHLDPPGRVLLAIPLSTEAVSGKPDSLRLRVPEDVLPHLNDKLLDRPAAIGDDAFIGELEAAEQWARKQAGRKQSPNVQAWLELGFDLLASVSACDPRAEDLTGAPGAMGGRKPLMARLVPFEDSAGSTKFIANTYDTILNLPPGVPLPGLMERWSGKASVPLPHLDLDGLLAAADHHVGHMDSFDHRKPGSARVLPTRSGAAGGGAHRRVFGHPGRPGPTRYRQDVDDEGRRCLRHGYAFARQR